MWRLSFHGLEGVQGCRVNFNGVADMSPEAIIQDMWECERKYRTVSSRKTVYSRLRTAYEFEGVGTVVWPPELSRDKYVEHCLEQSVSNLVLAKSLLRISPSEATVYKSQYQEKINNRKDSLAFITNPEHVINTAVSLLGSYNVYDIVVGLGVLTGRRSSEICSTMELEEIENEPYYAVFTGQLKCDCPEPYRIPLLAPFYIVNNALQTLRRRKPEWFGISLDRVNALTTMGCNRRVKSVFGDLFGEKCHMHDTRACYATIAHFVYGSNMHSTRFYSRVLGHWDNVSGESYAKFQIPFTKELIEWRESL